MTQQSYRPATSDNPHALDGHADRGHHTHGATEARSTLLEQVAALTEQLDAATDKVAHLTIGLESNRRIGYAVGILMCRHKLTPEQAIAMLTEVSNTRQRKMRDLAEDVILTGQLEGASTRRPGNSP